VSSKALRHLLTPTRSTSAHPFARAFQEVDRKRLASIRGSTSLRCFGTDSLSCWRWWAACSRWSVQLFLCAPGRALSAGGQGVAVAGGLYPMVLRHNVSQ